MDSVVRTVERNATLGLQDPRCAIGADVLLGTGNYAGPNGQVGFDPFVLD